MARTTHQALVCVVTSIQQPTEAMAALSRRAAEGRARLLVIGDAKSPPVYDLPGVEFHSLDQQRAMPFELSSLLPTGHYCRKNLGYLLAMSAGASSIYETDDDNAPLRTWAARQETVTAHTVAERAWVNAYVYFSTETIWPRGFPLDELKGPADALDGQAGCAQEWQAPIQQGLANGSPDVDAIWRLVLDREFEFGARPSIRLSPGSWCPFNSQSTWWWPQAWSLMYLPAYCSFRMTDIWRSFIAQRCLWELGNGVVFHAPEVVQARNQHDLMRDFADEVVGYLRNKEMVSVLTDLTLAPGEGNQGENLLRCYEALVSREFFPAEELALVKAWLADIKAA